MPTRRAISLSDWPLTQALPRAMTGSWRVPSANSSSSAPASVRMLREMNGIWCLPRNSLVRRQLVQPGCQYTLIGSSEDVFVMSYALASLPQRYNALHARHRPAAARTFGACSCCLSSALRSPDIAGQGAAPTEGAPLNLGPWCPASAWLRLA